MLLIGRLAGVAILVWFYLTAKKKGESPVKWALLGFIGYWLTWGLVYLTIVKSLAGMIQGNFAMAFFIYQLPVAIAIGACFFIRKKLIADASAEKN
ncbi:MAG: hypothetical protein ACXW0L_02350 [Methylosarcina sp.]